MADSLREMSSGKLGPALVKGAMFRRWGAALVLLGILLLSVVADAATMTYEYDARGNVVRIQQFGASSSTLTVDGFSPTVGEPGIQVQIEGSGFGLSPGANTVQFNGTSAPVLWASATRLLVSVPMQATSGPLGVTVNGVTALADEPFVVSQLDRPPVITSMAPTNGPIGTSILLRGKNFNPYPGQTIVKLNGIYVPTTSINDVQLVIAVPPYVGSGLVSVTTVFGEAIFSTSFLVLPAGILGGDVTVQVPVIADDDPVSVSLNSSGKTGVIQFSGEVGDFMTLWATQLTGSAESFAYQVRDPTNAVISSGSLASMRIGLHLPKLTQTGTYSVFVSATAGSGAFLVDLEKAATLSAASATKEFSARPTRRFTFSALAGENLGLGISDFVETNAGLGFATLTIYKPDGAELTSLYCYPSRCDANLINPPATGVYSVVLTTVRWDLEPNLTMAFKATLSHEVSSTLTAGVQETINLSRPGQNGRISFSGTSGATLGLLITGVTTVPAGSPLGLTIYKPDGSVLRSAATPGIGDGYTFNLPNLPVTGTYKVFIDPSRGATVTLNAKVVSSEMVEVVADGDTYVQSTTEKGESPYFTFFASVGENLGLGISNFVENNAVLGFATLTIYKPEGSELTSLYCHPSLCDVNLVNIPATGIYSVVLTTVRWDLEPNLTMAFKATLSHEVSSILTAGVQEAINLSRPGQNGRISFSGASGDTLGLLIAGVTTIPAGSPLGLTIYKPDGSVLRSAATPGIGDGYTFLLPNLPVTGTYTVFINPSRGATATLNATLTSSNMVEVVADGAPRIQPMTQKGESPYFAFSATAGENLGLGISDFIEANGVLGFATLTIYKPDGSELTSVSCHPPRCDVNLLNIPATGTYTVLLTTVRWDLEPNLTMSFKATLSHEVSSVLTSGVREVIELSRTGQNGWLSFNGTSGATIGLLVAEVNAVPAGSPLGLTIYKPDGSVLRSASTPGIGDGFTFNLPNLPATGTYRVFIDPHRGATATLKVTAVTSDMVGVTVDGDAYSPPTTLKGENPYFTFSAIAGENLGLGISNFSRTAGFYDYAIVTISKPDGSALTSFSCPIPACDVNLLNVPATGIYSVMFTSPRLDLEANLTTSLTATLSHESVSTLNIGSVETVSFVRTGQNGRASFSGTAGAVMGLLVSDIVTTPLGRSVGLTVYRPDGTVFRSASTPGDSAGHTFNLTNLPATGMYELFLDPSQGVTGSTRVVVVSSGMVEAIVDGVPRTQPMSQKGESPYFTFYASSGQSLTLEISDLVEANDYYGYVILNVYRPDGSLLTGTSCYEPGCSINLNGLPTTGVYSVLLTSPRWDLEPGLKMSFTAAVSTQ